MERIVRRECAVRARERVRERGGAPDAAVGDRGATVLLRQARGQQRDEDVRSLRRARRQRCNVC